MIKISGKFTESKMQQQIIKWARACEFIYPELKLLHSIPNGAAVSANNRKRLVSEGLLKGIPDMFLPVPRGTFHGFYIELKTEKGRLSTDQKVVIEMLKRQGFKVEIIKDFHDAVNQIENYLKLKK